MSEDWREYQERTAQFFRSIGLEASTDATMKGVRTSHDIDVLVRSHHAGFTATWIVECKHWRASVSKLHVLALRQIVADLGADRGILLAENGFQSGAKEAAALTNIQLTSLLKLQSDCEADFNAMRLRDLFDRLLTCKERYWDIEKTVRISHGLRPEVGTLSYSADSVVKSIEEILGKAARGKFPFHVDELASFVTFGANKSFGSFIEVFATADAYLTELEGKLNGVP